MLKLPNTKKIKKGKLVTKGNDLKMIKDIGKKMEILLVNISINQI